LTNPDVPGKQKQRLKRRAVGCLVRLVSKMTYSYVHWDICNDNMRLYQFISVNSVCCIGF